MPSQHASAPGPAHHPSPRVEVTHAASTTRSMCRLRRYRVGRGHPRSLVTSCRGRHTGVPSSRTQPRSHRGVGPYPPRAVRRPPRGGRPRTHHRPARLCRTPRRVPRSVPRQSCAPRHGPRRLSSASCARCPPAAALQLALLRTHRATLQPLLPPSAARCALAPRVAHRRRLVGDTGRRTNRLPRSLKNSVPHVLQGFEDTDPTRFCACLPPWPNLARRPACAPRHPRVLLPRPSRT
jgi:hypothetical protein